MNSYIDANATEKHTVSFFRAEVCSFASHRGSLFEIWGSHHSEDDDVVLLDSDTVWIRRQTPAFRRNIPFETSYLPTNPRGVTAQKNNIAYLIQIYLNKIILLE
jgi:hypothetical protein